MIHTWSVQKSFGRLGHDIAQRHLIVYEGWPEHYALSASNSDSRTIDGTAFKFPTAVMNCLWRSPANRGPSRDGNIAYLVISTISIDD